VSASVKKIQQLRERDLSGERFFGLILDGVFLTREIVVLVGIGLCCDGRKKVLDFEVGSSENLEVARELIRRLVQRRFVVEGRLFAIVDGSPALEKAVLECWPGTEIQRCLVHKERNLHAHLRRKDHAECSRLMDRLRKAEGELAGREALGKLKEFLATRSQEALQSIEEAGERLISPSIGSTCPPRSTGRFCRPTSSRTSCVTTAARPTGCAAGDPKATRWPGGRPPPCSGPRTDSASSPVQRTARLARCAGGAPRPGRSSLPLGPSACDEQGSILGSWPESHTPGVRP
jgi:hypothetical protein